MNSSLVPMLDALDMSAPTIENNESENLPSLELKTEPSDLSSDFDTARENLKTIIDIGTTAAKELAAISSQSQHPGAYEVLGTMLKTMLDAQQDMMNLHKKKNDIVKTTPGEASPIQRKENGSHVNILTVGSTADLQKLIESMAKK